MPIVSPVAGCRQSHLPRAMALALATLASTALTQAARAAEFASAIDLGSLDGATGFRLDGIDAGDFSGFSVASAGDVNGDGFADIVIGAPWADPNTDSRAGESYVVFGKASGFASAIDLGSLNGTTGFRLDGIDIDDFSGISVASAGDVNGDGFADLVIGAYFGDPNTDSAAGESYVVFGKAGGFASAIDLASLNGATGFRLDGIDIDDLSGRSVASAGDVNGDGFADIVIGAWRSDPNGNSDAGESYVVFGKAAGFASAIDLGSLNGTTGFRLDGIDANDVSGFSVASAGDVNGDGFAEIVIGAYGGNSLAGESYVVFGKAAGFASVIDLGSLDGATGFRLDGVAGGRSGRSVASAGDVNGDGFSDVIVGAYGANSVTGASYVVFGKASGFASAIDLGSLNGTTGFRLDGIDVSDRSGCSVAAAGDVNGDGFGDIVIGANRGDPNGNFDAGESYVVFGKASGFASAIDLGGLNGTTGFRLDGIDASDVSGFSAASAGDVNGDGFADVVIGAYGGASAAGESYVLFGRAPDGPVTRVGSAAGQYISGGAFTDILAGRGGNDRLEGRAGADSLDGGAGIDAASYAHAVTSIVANLASPAGNFGDAAGDGYVSIENLIGSRFADTLTGNGLANTLTGGKSADTLRGGGGNDRLIGGPGRDVQTGGTGADIFLFSKQTESIVGISRDQIVDFNAGSSGTSVDKIDLRPIDARTNVAGNQAFTFIGTSAFSGISGQLRISLSGSTTIVSGDVNGDSVADFQIGLIGFTNLANLTGIDFLK